MEEIVKLVGIEQVEWTDKSTGEAKGFAKLHVMYEQGGSITAGKKVAVISPPKGFDETSLRIGSLYELQYELFDGKYGKGAKLVGIVPAKAA